MGRLGDHFYINGLHLVFFSSQSRLYPPNLELSWSKTTTNLVCTKSYPPNLELSDPFLELKDSKSAF